jgi:hypothetical protein
MPARLFLSNDSTVSGGGIEYDEELVFFGTASETSAHGASALQVGSVIAKGNGTIVDLVVGVSLPAVSASGFVSGTTLADVRINSAVVCSTQPSIPMAGSAGAAARKCTLAGGGVSAVINANSAAFSAGDMISIDWNAVSVGSAAAGAAGKGVSGYVKLRYNAR